MPLFNVICSGKSVHKHLPIERNVCCLYTYYCESSISLEGSRSGSLSTSFQEGPHQTFFFDLRDKKTTRKQK